MLPRDGAVIGIDLADEKQALAVIDHDVRVVARKTVRVKAFRLGDALGWAVEQARANDLPRTFRTADLWLIHAADCRSRYSLRACRGVRY
jgi:hypothetical protein